MKRKINAFSFKENKKVIFSNLLLMMCVIVLSFNMHKPYDALESTVIPDEAIRLRILANSNSEKDQEVKRQIRDLVNVEIAGWVENYKSIELARAEIARHLPEIKEIVAHELKARGIQQSFSVKLGKVAFPTKMYGDYIYPAGNYEAVLITLGEGLGANWWCVLFPPLCFLDIDSGQAVKEENGSEAVGSDAELEAEKAASSEDDGKVEVKFFLVEWFSKLFG
ncbi:stage II sporulation protein R [Bacillus taeanensis]|uniref:Stage II sporulation protein R n=1 Tax=Bacillus taeanensis TaxID=273032 RepID=A0A366XUD0_9BACI|nr:stage II sporulation protein R [Bacillus taeanensis]RBW68755.1 stage II sporulation protein R [Bacillus taeanensis]